MRDFEGKVAVITGGASGIGFAMATRFAQEGMKVVLGDVEAPALEAAVARLRQQEFEVHGVVTDVSDGASVENLARETIDRFGKVHVLCNNAGIGGARAPRIWDATREGLAVDPRRQPLGRHPRNPHLRAAHAVTRRGRARREHGFMAGLAQGNRAYSVSKHGVVALSEALYDGLKLEGAKVGASVLCPGLTNTNLTFSTRNRPDNMKDDPGAQPTPEELERAAQTKQWLEGAGIAAGAHGRNRAAGDQGRPVLHPDAR